MRGPSPWKLASTPVAAAVSFATAVGLAMNAPLTEDGDLMLGLAGLLAILGCVSGIVFFLLAQDLASAANPKRRRW